MFSYLTSPPGEAWLFLRCTQFADQLETILWEQCVLARCTLRESLHSLSSNLLVFWRKKKMQIINFVVLFLKVVILDVRVPCTPVARLNNHRACVNGIAWAPHSSCHICTAGRCGKGFQIDLSPSTLVNLCLGAFHYICKILSSKKLMHFSYCLLLKIISDLEVLY